MDARKSCYDACDRHGEGDGSSCYVCDLLEVLFTRQHFLNRRFLQLSKRVVPQPVGYRVVVTDAVGTDIEAKVGATIVRHVVHVVGANCRKRTHTNYM